MEPMHKTKNVQKLKQKNLENTKNDKEKMFKSKTWLKTKQMVKNENFSKIETSKNRKKSWKVVQKNEKSSKKKSWKIS